MEGVWLGVSHGGRGITIVAQQLEEWENMGGGGGRAAIGSVDREECGGARCGRGGQDVDGFGT